MDLLREKEADWEAERRRLARMGAFLHNAKDKMALAQTVRPGEIRLETFPEAHCAVVEAPDLHMQNLRRRFTSSMCGS